jgi:hypothetical protein
MGIIRGLSLLQPWASLVEVGAKKIETRSWSTPYRGWIAIHASKRFAADDKILLGNERFRNALLSVYPNPLESYLPTGAIIAVARLVDCLSTNTSPIPDETEDEFWFGDYSPNRWMWRFDDVTRLTRPIPCIGALGLWPLPEEIVEQLRGEVRRKKGDSHNKPGDPYRPSNGTEGEWFMNDFCHRCRRDRNQDCEIIPITMGLDTDEDDYPHQWTYDLEGRPTCTAFVSLERSVPAAPRKSRELARREALGQASLFVEHLTTR